MTWDDYFMGLAHSVAAKSKDPSTKVGAIIVDADRRLVSTGFNGPPRNTIDTPDTDRDIKLLRTLHAEENAILFAGIRLTGCTLYSTHHPCAHCAAVIIQSGIGFVIHPPVPDVFGTRWQTSMDEARRMFQEARVTRRVLGV